MLPPLEETAEERTSFLKKSLAGREAKNFC